jgi:hypothetical protein
MSSPRDGPPSWTGNLSVPTQCFGGGAVLGFGMVTLEVWKIPSCRPVAAADSICSLSFGLHAVPCICLFPALYLHISFNCLHIGTV